MGSRSSDVEAVFRAPEAESRAVHGDAAVLAREVYGPPETVPHRPEPRRSPTPVMPSMTRKERRLVEPLRRRAEYLAQRIDREPRGGAAKASSYDRQELSSLRWVLDEVLPGWFRRAR